MKEFYKNFLANNLYFWVFAILSILLIVISFVLPPAGAVDPTVALSVGELFGFASLGTVIKAIDKGKSASVSHGQTTITIGDKEEPEYGVEDQPEI